MLSRAEKARLESLNLDHHRRMLRDEKDRIDRGEQKALEALDAESRRALCEAMRGADARFGMRRGPGIVLELGAWKGKEKSALVEALEAGSYVGIDVASGGAAIDLMAIEELPASWRGLFSFVYSRHVMEHVIDPALALERIEMVLAPNGIVGAVTPHFFPDTEPAHLSVLRLEEWVSLYERAGLRVVYAVEKEFFCKELHLVAIHDDWPFAPL